MEIHYDVRNGRAVFRAEISGEMLDQHATDPSGRSCEVELHLVLQVVALVEQHMARLAPVDHLEVTDVHLVADHLQVAGHVPT